MDIVTCAITNPSGQVCDDDDDDDDLLWFLLLCIVNGLYWWEKRCIIDSCCWPDRWIIHWNYGNWKHMNWCTVSKLMSREEFDCDSDSVYDNEQSLIFTPIISIISFLLLLL